MLLAHPHSGSTINTLGRGVPQDGRPSLFSPGEAFNWNPGYWPSRGLGVTPEVFTRGLVTGQGLPAQT